MKALICLLVSPGIFVMAMYYRKYLSIFARLSVYSWCEILWPQLAQVFVSVGISGRYIRPAIAFCKSVKKIEVRISKSTLAVSSVTSSTVGTRTNFGYVTSSLTFFSSFCSIEFSSSCYPRLFFAVFSLPTEESSHSFFFFCVKNIPKTKSLAFILELDLVRAGSVESFIDDREKMRNDFEVHSWNL